MYSCMLLVCDTVNIPIDNVIFNLAYTCFSNSIIHMHVYTCVVHCCFCSSLNPLCIYSLFVDCGLGSEEVGSWDPVSSVPRKF